MKLIIMRAFALLFPLIFSGCVGFETGLKLAEYGVKIGFEVGEYAKEKRQEVKEIIKGEDGKNE